MASSEHGRTAPPLDAELAEPLARILSDRPASLLPSGISRDRERSEAGALADDELSLGGLYAVEAARTSSSDGATQIDLVVLTPVTAAEAPRPVVLSIHGGGLVAGHHRSPELLPELRRAAELGMAVVSVDYRLAPDNPHPAPVEDCYSALLWMWENADAWDFDRSSMFVSGVSAGGALAAAVALLARDRQGPPLRGQVLLCPMLDDRVDTPSAHQMTGLGLWDSVSNRTGWSALLGSDRGTDDVPAYAAPARAKDLSGLPPAYIDVGAYESLRDESIDYAARLARSGVDVELHVWGGAFHSFDEWVPEALVSVTAQLARVNWVRRHLADAGAEPATR